MVDLWGTQGKALAESPKSTPTPLGPPSLPLQVGDKAGGVSLLDMFAPGVLWYNDGMAGPVTAVQLGMCALPSRKDKWVLGGAAGIRSCMASHGCLMALHGTGA